MKPKTLKLLLTLLAITASVFLLRSAGIFLVKTATIRHADATLILMGSIADRVLQAKDIYNSGNTNEILIVNNIQYGSEYLAQFNVYIPNGAQLSRRALTQFNIPDSLITILPGQASSTRAEAEIIANWLKQNPQIDTLIIVSSAAHMRRARMIFNDTFNDYSINVTILSVPSKYSDFKADKWWTDRESAKQVLMEYTKMASFLLVEQWQ